MPRRSYRPVIDSASGVRFLFAYETGADGPLHIEARHGTTIDEAIETFLTGVTTWNDVHKRFETSAVRTLYWAHHGSGSILVITCF